MHHVKLEENIGADLLSRCLVIVTDDKNTRLPKVIQFLSNVYKSESLQDLQRINKAKLQSTIYHGMVFITDQQGK